MSYTELRLYADMFADIQEFRKSMNNKLRSGTVSEAAKMEQHVQTFEAVEHQMSLSMRRSMRLTVSPSILTWQKTENGIGEHLLARLLGVIGDPYRATPYHWEGTGKHRVLLADAPYTRTVMQLWAYCGHGDPTRRRIKGMSAQEAVALGNPKAKMLVHLLAEGCVKHGIRKLDDCDDSEGYDINHRQAISRYGQVYYDSRLHYCHREGWTSLHQHNASLRRVGKAVLKDLWIAARADAEVEQESLGEDQRLSVIH